MPCIKNQIIPSLQDHRHMIYWQIFVTLHLICFAGRTMNTSETLLRWETSLCHLERDPQVYQDIGEHVTGLLSDKLPQTCESLFPLRTSFATSVMFIHRILPSSSPRLNVIGRFTDCSPITGLWMVAMGDSGVLHSCTSYIGVDVGDFTSCRYRCDTGGLVNHVVVGISDRRTLSSPDIAVICDLALVWGWLLIIVEYLSSMMRSYFNTLMVYFQNTHNRFRHSTQEGVSLTF